METAEGDWRFNRLPAIHLRLNCGAKRGDGKSLQSAGERSSNSGGVPSKWELCNRGVAPALSRYGSDRKHASAHLRGRPLYLDAADGFSAAALSLAAGHNSLSGDYQWWS